MVSNTSLAHVLLVLAGVAAMGSSAQQPPVAETPDRLYLVQLSLGPAWVEGTPPHEQPKFGEHGQNLGRLRAAGRIVLGARYSDKGMIVLRAPSEEAAKAEMAADPGVVAGIFVFELFEMQPFYEGCLTTAAR